MKKILFVCTGNICRSPTAEAIFRHRVENAGLSDAFTIDSAGVQGFHSGEPADHRSIDVAARYNIDMNDIRARKVKPADFSTFDLILAMDSGHLKQLQHACPKNAPAETALFLDYAGHAEEQDVPDPYYGSMRDFEEMFNLIDAGATGVLKRLIP